MLPTELLQVLGTHTILDFGGEKVLPVGSLRN